MKTLRHTLPLAVFAGLLCPAGLAAPTSLHTFEPSSVQDDDDDEEKEKPDKREEIEELLEKLDDHVKARGDEDTEAVALIDELVTEFPESGPKDRKSIVKQLTKHFKVKRKPTDEGLLDNKLFIATAVALGEMAPESVDSLTKYAEHKTFDKNVQVKRALVLALGTTKHEDAVEPLQDFLRHHEAQLQAAAAESLGGFTHLEQKERKEIFESIMKEVIRVKNIIDVNQVDPIERKRYDTIAGPMLTAMQELSGFEARDPNAFRDWWNDNKKKDWDEGKDD